MRIPAFVLKFHGDAIVLSGTTGTKLKSSVVGQYYTLWWTITSGGPASGHAFPTAIVEINAGTGQDFIEETGETILGSAGHALELKLTNPRASRLTLVLIESDELCYQHLKNVILKISPNLPLSWAEGPPGTNRTGIYMINKSLNDALDIIEQVGLGNSLFFFDPLLYTPWTDIDKVASLRIRRYYQTGTEFIVFLFSSDWFLGRDKLAPLPRTTRQSEWGNGELEAVKKMDDLLGHTQWRSELLTNQNGVERLGTLVQLYRQRLHKWFRYVLPLPFEPKPGQTYHLFVCSNYEDGVRITRDFYVKYTGNKRFSPDNRHAYSRFLTLHHELKSNSGLGRPDQWKILWKVIRDHDEGICDEECEDLKAIQPSLTLRKSSLEWLSAKGYLESLEHVTDAWKTKPALYRLAWPTLKRTLDIGSPSPLEPLKPE